MKNIFTILGLSVLMLLFSHRIQAQNSIEYYKAQAYLTQKGEVYFTFNISSRNEIATLTKIVSIDNVKGMQVFAYANANGFSAFTSLGYAYTVLPHPGDVTEGIVMHSADKGIWQFDTYPTYPEYESMMTTFATNYPGICKLVQIGTSVNGRKLLFAKISDNVNIREAEPRFMYSSSMHGDETTGYVLMLRLINYLLTNYGTNTEVTSLVDNMEIWINPLANPDGTYKTGDGSVSGAVRFNANNVDLNRHFPGPLSLHPDGASTYQPEALAMMNLSDTIHFVASANFHGGAEVMNFPWDTWVSSTRTHADDLWWRHVCKEYVDTTRLVTPAYMTDVIASGYIEGGDWYVVDGSRQDFFEWYRHTREVTAEISSTKLVAANTLPAYWNTNWRALINYMKEAQYGIRGIVTNSCNGQAIVAKVFVNSHDTDSSFVYSEAGLGDYYRPIMPGTYSVTYTASGYVSQTKTVSVASNDTSIVNVQLVPLAPVADFTSDVTSTCSGTVNFSCLTPAVDSWNWNFGDGTTSTEQNPTHVYTTNGTFTVSLTVTSCAGSDQLVNTNFITANLAAVPVTTSASRCGSGSLTLTATGSGSLFWYDAPTGGNMVAANDTLVTPVLSQTTTYYVESAVTQPSQYAGLVSSTTNGAMYNQATLAWLNFDCLTDFILVSVEVNAATTASREISLYNSAGVKLDSVIVTIPSGVSRVTLNFHVAPGTGYRLTGSMNANLYRTQNLLTFPYTLPGVLSIYSGGITSSPSITTRYYYFYNWEVQEIGCISARTSATATVSAGPQGGTAQANVSSLCSGNFTTVSVSGNTGTSIQWQQSPNGTNSWVNVTGGSGATTSTYTTPVLTSTLYYRAVVSSAGCSDSYSTVSQITVNANPVVSASSSNVTCFGAANGTAVAMVSGGQVPYSYNWSNGSSNSSLLYLNPGVYSVIVTDVNQCSGMYSVTVTEPTQLNVYTTPIDATCGNANGSATAAASGGTGALGMQWSNSTTGSSIQNVLAGTYFVTVTDANGCTDTAAAVINNLAQFNASVSSTTLQCYGDQTASATAVVTGGAAPITYNWSTGASVNSISGLGAGTVTVTITDNNSCSTVISETISEPSAVVATFNTTSTTCGFNNGAIITNASGGTGTLSYSWSNSIFTANQTGIASGLYDLTITDGNGCTFIYQALVNAIPIVSGNITTQSVSCYGGSNGSATIVAVDGVPPYTYLWSTGSTLNQISSLPAGSVTVTVTDNSGCTAIITNTVPEPNQISADLTIVPESFAGANDGSAIAVLTGGTAPYNYSWSNGSHTNSITNVPAGTYSLAVVDAHGCFFTLPVVIDILISVSEMQKNSVLEIYPNPAKDHILVKSEEKIVKIELISVTGQVVLILESGNKNVNLSQISNGMYLIRVTTHNGATLMHTFIVAK